MGPAWMKFMLFNITLWNGFSCILGVEKACYIRSHLLTIYVWWCRGWSRGRVLHPLLVCTPESASATPWLSSIVVALKDKSSVRFLCRYANFKYSSSAWTSPYIDHRETTTYFLSHNQIRSFFLEFHPHQKCISLYFSRYSVEYFVLKIVMMTLSKMTYARWSRQLAGYGFSTTCLFGKSSLSLYGFTFTKDGVSPDSQKVTAIKEAAVTNNLQWFISN